MIVSASAAEFLAVASASPQVIERLRACTISCDAIACAPRTRTLWIPQWRIDYRSIVFEGAKVDLCVSTHVRVEQGSLLPVGYTSNLYVCRPFDTIRQCR